MFGPERRPFFSSQLFMFVAGVLLASATITADAQEQVSPADQPIGRDASGEEIASWDIDIEPDGTGLPAGTGTVVSGREIYNAQCLICHGPTASENPGDTGISPNLTNNWCCATTLYDYIYRAMPYYAPQSLEPDEIYGLVALLLYLNDIVPEDFIANARTIPEVTMPAAEFYGVNPWTSGVIAQPGDPWSHDDP